MPTNLKQTIDKYIGDVIRHNHTDLVDIYNDQTINGNKTLLGDVNVYGTFHAASAVIINTEIIDVSANYITLNSNLTGTPFETAGIKVNRGLETDSVIEWNETSGRWLAGVSGLTENIVLVSDLNPITADIQNIASTSGNWNSVYSTVGANSANWEISDYIPISGSNNIYGSLVPSVSTITLGTSSNPWSGLFVSSGSLHIGNNKISSNISGQLLINNDVIITSNNINIDSNGNLNNVNSIQFDISPTSGVHSAGRLHFDEIFGTLGLDIDGDVVLQLGQETLCYVYNGTGSAVTKGQLVYILGAESGIPSVGLADASDVNKAFVLGVVTTASIATGNYGYVTIRGHVNDLDTSAWTVGTCLFLSATTPGALTATPPSEGNFDVRIGRVMIQDASTGRVYVNIRPLSRLTDLGDVTVTTPTTDQILRYNGTEWVNGNAVAVNAGAGVDFFLDDTTIIPAGTDNAIVVQTLNKYPVSSTAEEVDTITVNNNTVPYGSYLYNSAIGGTSIDAGVWTFDFFAAVSSSVGTTELLINTMRVRPETGTVTITGTGTSRTATASTGTPFAEAKIDASATNSNASYLQTPLGLYQITARTSDTEVTITTPTGYTNETTVAYSVHKKLFQVTTGDINNTATSPLYAGLQLYTITSAQSAYTITAVDKLACFVFGKTTRTSNTNIFFSHNGTSRYSFFKTPLVVRHNQLSTLQGGGTDEFYHLTSAQYTIATQAASNSAAGYITTEAQSLSGVKTFSNFPITPSSSPTTDYEVANKYYVDHRTLTTNTTVNLTSGMTAAQIQALIDAQPRNLNTYTLTFQFADGTYNTAMTSSLVFSFFYNGALTIQGNTGEADATVLHTSQAVYLDFSAGSSNGIVVNYCNCLVTVRNLKIKISDTAAIRCISSASCPTVNIQYNYLFGANNTNTNVGFGCTFTSAYAVSNYVSTLQTGIAAFNASTIYSSVNDDTGTAPKYGIAAQQAGTIGKNSTQPAGSIGNEYTATGGEIR